MEHNAQPGTGIALIHDCHPCWCSGNGGATCSVHFTVVVVVVAPLVFERWQRNAFAPITQIVGTRCRIEQGMILFLDLVAWMGQCLGNCTVVGEQHQSFAGEVETTHQVQSLWHFNHAGDGRATLRVFGGGYHTHRFVEHDIRAWLACAEWAPIH